MTIEGAIVDLQNLIDSDGIPFWAKPSLQKVMETVEAERERYIEERNNRDMVSRSDVISICNILADKMDDEGRVAVEQVRDAVKDMRPYEGAEEEKKQPCGKCIHFNRCWEEREFMHIEADKDGKCPRYMEGAE